jgi:hypothetical protein
MQSPQRHLGQSFGMVLLFAMTCFSMVALVSRMG